MSTKAFAFLLLGVGFAACGGKVVFEEPGGNGGAGGTGNTTGSLTTSTTTSGITTGVTTGITTSVTTSSGPGCDCQTMCNILQSCGLTGPECPSYCNDIPPETAECVCYTNGGCQGVESCFGGTGSGGAGGGNGFPSDECIECVNQGFCAAQQTQCDQNPDCQNIIMCHDDCGWGYECNGICDPQYPDGYSDWLSYVDCLVCQNCYDPCATSSLINYCFDG